MKKHIQAIQEVVEKNKRAYKSEHFTGISPEEIKKKLMRVNSPFIVSQGWGSASPGGSFTYSLGIYNPDPTQASSLYAHVWVGSGNVDPVVGTFLLNVDTRFPRLTEPEFFGLSLAPGASATLSFTVKVPTGIEQSKYLGNSCLMELNYHDIGTYLDRGVFVFAVT
ncbi:hypothetical protein JY651_17165 [Pyxidicoccus parkwayensis]|uniref:Uncharacterized protein n=1 Tax=Pyxidicoccus parkwayensis TaxID=2813578 RepID=A0ABX7P7W1_9BACT|nr:hypothetical protein [Pyxidicoccus parkwaysis]QSQ26553.1 hypothetical protein JY651_17165 [Pyxidicoccus parkwaysis]